MATLIPADGTAPRFIEPANGRSFTAEELHKLVGGYFEVLRSHLFIPGDGDLFMFVNEDGKRAPLPLNVFATGIARAAKALKPGDAIVGDVVLCTATEAGEGDDAESTDDP